ncbi:MAG: adenylate/guanylate cyclase domain-containing protein [Proteobacteria bacterium]|jgi:class 3 adenylate cyclase|nr:adenylate/guanylate cyclase domain-containing protein [Pseudomonadota bacterium]
MEEQKPNLVERLLGDSSFSSQHRMSLAFLLAWAVGSLLCLPANASMGLSWLPQMVVLAMALYSLSAWAAFRSKWLSPDWAAVSFVPLTLVGVPYFWFAFEGSGGPAIPMTFGLLVFTVLASGETTVIKQLLWVLSYEALLALLLLAELVLPNLFLHLYTSDVERITDRGTAMVFAIAVVGTLLVVYSREHRGSPGPQQSLTSIIEDTRISETLEKDGVTHLIASSFSEATVLCADFVGFDDLLGGPPAAVVSQLDSLLSAFDEICRTHGLERVKTSSGSYVAVSGIVQQRWDHVEAAADAALAMVNLAESKSSLQLGLALHTGALIAGIEGTNHFAWGEALHLARLLQIHGQPGRITVLRPTRRLLEQAFEVQRAPAIELAEAGSRSSWIVTGRRKAAG